MPPISRRHLLASTGLVTAGVLGAAGLGAAVAALHDLPARAKDSADDSPPPAPAATGSERAVLIDALQRENQLIDLLAGASTGPSDPQAAALPALLADHRAHAAAITALIGPRRTSTPAPSTSSPAPSPTIEQVRSAEQSAHDGATKASGTVSSAAAVLLASIAACEAGHVELMS